MIFILLIFDVDKCYKIGPNTRGYVWHQLNWFFAENTS